MQGNKNHLFINLNYNNTVKYIKFTLNCPLSRAQIEILILTFTIKLTPLKSTYFYQYGLYQELMCYYLSTLTKLGYLSRIKRGNYVHTDKALQLYQDFQTELNRRQSQPFSWK